MKDIYEILSALEIDYEEAAHIPVYTVEEAAQVRQKLTLTGKGCKNLFLRDKGKNYFWVIQSPEKRADLKALAAALQLRRLSFASEEELAAVLKLSRGAVSPFGLIHDDCRQVTVIVDKDLNDQRLVFHPNNNAKSISLSHEDFAKFLQWTGNRIIYW